MPELDRRSLMMALAAAGLLPRQALAADARVFTAKIAIENDRVIIGVAMNGKGPFVFMIDTGTYVSMIRPDLAAQLGLPKTGVERTVGIGGGRGTPFNTYMARDFIIGGGIRQESVVLTDAFAFGYSQDIYGALAAGILTSYDTDLDFDAGELRIYPDGRGERPGYAAVASEIPRAERPDRGSRKIMVMVAVDGRPVRCEVDTGSPHMLLLNQSKARQLGLWDGRPYVPTRPNGIGGTGPIARSVRTSSLAMGAARAERPIVTLLGTDLDGADGIVGLAFLCRANLSIDVRGRKLWVKPSGQTIPPERYGLSGLWLERDGAKIAIADVGTGSPAASAGLRRGDRIAGDWDATLRAINGRAGSVARLRVESGGTARDVALPLAPYL